jgi:CRP-like cAMP-binding protein
MTMNSASTHLTQANIRRPPDPISCEVEASQLRPSLLESRLMQALPPEVQERVSQRGQFSVLPMGYYLTNQGKLDHSLAVVLSGVLSLSVHRGGDRIELTRARPGDCIGSMNLLDRLPASADIVVVSGPVQVWTITRAQFDELARSHLRDGFLLLSAVAQELCRLMRQQRGIMLHQIETVRAYYCEMEV